MRRAEFRRGFPWNTALLVCSVPVFVLVIFAAWFRWELPPLQAYYLKSYWECYEGASTAGNTSEIEWLYKSASGRKSVPVIPHDVEFRGVGLLPVELSSSARQDGWTNLVKLPAQTWSSPELKEFFQRDFYDGQTFEQVIAQPMFLIGMVPFIFIIGVLYMKHDIVEEWKQFYAGPFGDDLIVDISGVRECIKDALGRWKEGRRARSKAESLKASDGVKLTSIQQTNGISVHSAGNSSSSDQKPVVRAAQSARPTRRSIFPGALTQHPTNKAAKAWDESQWID
jgi:hypothetical protein